MHGAFLDFRHQNGLSIIGKIPTLALQVLIPTQIKHLHRNFLQFPNFQFPLFQGIGLTEILYHTGFLGLS